MKKYLITALIFLTACQSKQQKAESLVKAYLSRHLSEPKTYEWVEFEDVDTTLTTFEDDTAYVSAMSRKKALKEKFEKWNSENPKVTEATPNEARLILKVHEDYYEKMNDEDDKILKITVHHIPKFKGYHIIHLYKYSFRRNFHSVKKTDFFIDSNLSKITKTKTLAEF